MLHDAEQGTALNSGMGEVSSVMGDTSVKPVELESVKEPTKLNQRGSTNKGG